jgi:hypothetical protein
MAENWQDWTPCEMYGHDFDEDGRCPCGEKRIPDDNDTHHIGA